MRVRMMKMDKHYTELDYTKGFAILLLLFSHCHLGGGIIKTWIFSFHMPIFFMICGILQKRRETRDLVTRDIASYIKKRKRQLVFPLNIQQKRICVMISLATIFLFSWCRMPNFWLFKLIIKCIIALLFMIMGYYVADHIKKISVWKGGFLLVIGSALAEINGFVGIGALELKNPILFFTDAFLISSAVIALFAVYSKSSLQELRGLSFFGKNSIVVLLTNNLLIEVIRLLDYKITGSWLLKVGLIGSFIMTFGLILIESWVIIVSRKEKIRVIFGKY